MKTEEEIKAGIEQAITEAKKADTIQLVKFWNGFEEALKWLNSKEEKQDGFTDE